MLMEEDGFKAMKKAKELLPEDKVEQDWRHWAKDEMVSSVQKKFESCSHAHVKLLNAKMVIAEATGNEYWGIGLNVQQTLECLPDYWPGENVMGKILMDLRQSLQQEVDGKHKAESPLTGDHSKLVRTTE